MTTSLFSLRRSKIALAIGAVFALAAVPTSASALVADPPEFPANQTLYAFEYSTNLPGMVDPTSAEVTLLTETPSELVEAEGGGVDPATGITWLVSGRDCSLWQLGEDGIATQVYDLTVTTGNPTLGWCSALLLNGDGTAYVAGAADTTADPVQRTLMLIDLSDGSLIDELAVPQVTGLSIHPSTGVIWASVADEAFNGLSTFDPNTWTLTPQIDYGAIIGGQLIWDIAFDSRGILWMSSWGEVFNTLVSIDPMAEDPAATFAISGDFTIAGTESSFGTDAIWISTSTEPGPAPGPGPDPNSGQGGTPTLAQTGGDPTILIAGATVLLGLGLTALLASRRRRA